MKPESSYPTSIHVNGVPYEIDAETGAALQSGIVPEDLRNRIREDQGPEFCDDFRRQCKLIRDAIAQIESGELPASLTALVQSGDVPADILYKLTRHGLIGKAEKLYKHKLISLKILDTVRKEYLTPEILPALKQAFLIDTAVYLYHHNEISEAALNGFRNGSINPKYVLVIAKHFRRLGYLCRQEQDHSIYGRSNEDGTLCQYENLPDPQQQLEQLVSVSYEYSCLYEAMTWLSEEDYRLIRCLFFEDISQRSLAREWGVSEGTIRYKKKKVLHRLRVLLEGVFGITRKNIFDSDRI